MYSGSCLCGQITFQVDEAITDIECCHCLTCRKAHASAFAMGVTITRENFHISGSSGLLTEYESSPGKFRVFCNRCGSHVYAYRPAQPAFIRLRVACLDVNLQAFSIKHIHTESRLEI